jgi:ABC-2 type transport system permease protein
MTAESELAGEEPRAALAAPAAMPWQRVFYWSVRRELWEHPAVYVAPLAVAAIALVGFGIGAFYLPQIVQGAAMPGKDRGLLFAPYELVAFVGLVTSLLVAVFYSLGALQNERRDRSILFWKSLPVSDLTTVLSKATIPIVVQPVVVLAVVVVTTAIIWAVSMLIALANGIDPKPLLSDDLIPFVWRTLAEGLPGIALWYAPIYGWLMLVSAWSRRVAFLWAIAPPLLAGLVEALAFRTSVVWRWMTLRMFGPFAYQGPHGGFPGHPDPTDWANPQLWIGAVLAVAFFAGAAWLRRSREPT